MADSTDRGPRENAAQPLARQARGYFFRFNGIFLIIASLAIATIGWFALATLANNLAKEPDLTRQIAPSAKWCINLAAWLPLLMIPSIIGGVILMLVRDRSRFWLLLIITSLWLFMLFGAILYSFVMFLKPMYEYQPI